MSNIDESILQLQKAEAANRHRNEQLETAARAGRAALANYFDGIVKRFTDEHLPTEELALQKSSFAISRDEPRFEQSTISSFPVWQIGSLALSRAGDLWMSVRVKIGLFGYEGGGGIGGPPHYNQKRRDVIRKMAYKVSGMDISFTVPVRVDFSQLFDEWLKSARSDNRGIGRSIFSVNKEEIGRHIAIKPHKLYPIDFSVGRPSGSIPQGKGTRMVDEILITGSAWHHARYPNVSDSPVVSLGLREYYLDFETTNSEPLDTVLTSSCAGLILEYRRAFS